MDDDPRPPHRLLESHIKQRFNRNTRQSALFTNARNWRSLSRFEGALVAEGAFYWWLQLYSAVLLRVVVGGLPTRKYNITNGPDSDEQ